MVRKLQLTNQGFIMSLLCFLITGRGNKTGEIQGYYTAARHCGLAADKILKNTGAQRCAGDLYRQGSHSPTLTLMTGE